MPDVREELDKRLADVGDFIRSQRGIVGVVGDIRGGRSRIDDE